MDDEREYGYGEAGQSEHEHAHHDHQKNRGKRLNDDYHSHLRGYDHHARLVFDGSEEMGSDDLVGSMHATSDHPSDVLRHAVHRYEDDGSAHHDDGEE